MPTVCLVVPCYNEARRLDMQAFAAFIDAHPHVSFYFANDGSQDGTLAMLNRLQAGHSENVRVLDLAANVGKGEAVRSAVRLANAWQPFEYIGYWDADLATPLKELPMMQRLAEDRGCLIVLGSRIRRLGASIDRRVSRHIAGRVFATCASLLLRLPVYDTQCGAKLLHASVVPELFAQPFVSRWLFDVEVLARLRNLVGRERLLSGAVEAPLGSWRDAGGSTLALRDVLLVPFELWKIGRRYGRGTARSGSG